jgi:hypothetical protein
VEDYIMKKMVFCIIPLIMVIMGCASKVPAVAETNSNSAGMDLDTAIKEAAAQMETKIPSKTMVALVSVASPSTAFSAQVLTRLESAIVSGGKLVVVDRANLDKIREEQGFQLSGEVDDESAKSIGKLLGAGAIVTGSLTDLGDVYSLTLKAINIETATVAVSYLADLAKSARVETLLASGGGGASSRTATASASGGQPGRTSAGATATPPTPAAPTRVTVTYNINGASGAAPSAQTVEDGESITIPDKGAMTNSRGTFGGWNTKSDGTGTAYTVGDTFVVNDNTQLFARWIEQVYKVGDTGPAGGLIFFDKGGSSGGWRYLEAAPALLEFTAEWGTYDRDVSGTSTAWGTGKQNTELIIKGLRQSGESNKVADICANFEFGGYTDWFLPSKDELNLMYTNLKDKGLGGFGNGWYWSSSQSSKIGVWIQNFGNGNQSTDTQTYPFPARKNNIYPVRAARAF